jgi:hypothetical protein
MINGVHSHDIQKRLLFVSLIKRLGILSYFPNKVT